MKTNSPISQFVAAGLKVRTAKGGKLSCNHTRAGLNVKTAVKGGRLAANHIRAGLNVKTAVKGGRLAANHCGRALALDATARRRG